VSCLYGKPPSAIPVRGACWNSTFAVGMIRGMEET
jgi:hypothetical protein